MLQDIAASVSHQEDGMVLATHPGRHGQIDVDGVFYKVGKLTNSIQKDFESCVRYADWLRKASGSEFGILHSTQALKGGREQMAYQHPYQSKRHGYQDEEYMNRIRSLRQAFTTFQWQSLYGAAQFFVEADDSMSKAQHERIMTTLDPLSSVIVTNDKDLNMNNGLVMNIDTQKITHNGDFVVNEELRVGTWYNDWGWCDFRRGDAAKKKKLVGRGKAFFFAQLLAGDKADTIKGLPTIRGDIVNNFKPLKRGKRGAASEKQCGESLASEIISACGNERTALRIVREAYAGHFGQWGDFFLFENAFLLWMRLTDAPTDVLNYLIPLGFDYQLHPQQVTAIHTYLERCAELQRKLENRQ